MSEGKEISASGERSVAAESINAPVFTGDIKLSITAAWQLLSVRAPVPDFLGRDREVADLAELLRNGSNVAICGVNWLGGIGKTELALKVAEVLRDVFKDQLLIEMRGASNTPLALEDALARFR